MRGTRRALAFSLTAGLALTSAHGAGEPPRAPAKDEAPEPQSLHIPVLERAAEQGILRPVPLSVELPGDLVLRARRVLVHYRLWGMPDWTTIELRRNGLKHEGAIPCLEVSTVTGDLRYYIRVHDADGRVIATAASLARPFVVSIQHDAALAEAGKPQPRAGKCPDPADCPRGLPGCPSEAVVKIQCASDDDCDAGTICGFSGYCEKPTRRKSWVSLGLSQDFGVLPMSGACVTYSQENLGYACFRDDGEQYDGNPILTNEPPAGAIGNTRVVASFERLVHFDTTIGARVGFAFAGWGPTSPNGTTFFPLSIALRAAHWFGQDPFGPGGGLRPYVFLTAGAAMFDLQARGHVREDPEHVALQGDNDLEQNLDVWRRAGDGFVGAGAGLAIPFRGRMAAFGELGVVEVFPFGAVVFTPAAGMMMGF